MTLLPQLDPALAPATVYERLDPPVRSLVDAVQALYAGSWDDAAEDIRRRRAGRPHLFRIDLPVPDDLGWIARFKAYEAARGESFSCAAPVTAG